MKYLLTVIYKGEIDMSVEAPNRELAEEAALDEIDKWSEALFMERIDLEIEDIKFIK